MKKKLKVLLAVFALAMLSCQMVSAASVTFTNFSYTTVAYTDVPKQVASKTKADNEKNWYVTLTSSSGLSSSQARVLVTSNTKVSTLDMISALYPLYSTTSASGAIPYYSGASVGAGTNCKLIVSGNENLGGSYSVKISGRYTS